MARMAWRNAGRSSTATAKCWIKRFMVYCCCPVLWKSWSTCNSLGRFMLLCLLFPLPLLLFLCTHLYHAAIVLSLTRDLAGQQGCLHRQSRRLQGTRDPGVTRIKQTIIALGEIKHAVPMVMARTKGDGPAAGIAFVRGMDKAYQLLQTPP